MSVSQVPLRPLRRGALAKLWLGLLLLVGAALLLAWTGAGALRGETTESGLVFRTIEVGEGPLIKPVDGVLINYEGRLEDGTVFDASGGQPVPMIAGQVIPGFAEALQKMQKGGRYTIRIPGEQAYGANPPPNSPIPPNAPLEFDVQVVEVVPDAALMQQMQEQQPVPPVPGQPGP